ncbi:RWD domain-containing protein 1-like [Saccoglossus kowalevskii]|uniref:RWD domain-containing protein 1-like n=1 Tax=Saccoglossus kowalevskii TaxID=10224 RepID=A0ABM0H114_SACKO|nr:PREDICTED: RWD domain-containing protein 1-like [Saccoglossus kowalevskii]
MTDYQEEQNNEIEALASIYPDEFTALSEDPHRFKVIISSENTDEDGEDAAITITLQFTYTPRYPDEGPVMEVISADNLDEEDISSILQLLQEQVEENLGMAMVFTLVSAVQERLNEKVDEIKQIEKDEKERIEQEEKTKAEAEEAKKFVGTPVTIETFLAWKAKFDKEIEDKKRQASNEDNNKDKKLTGRQLFERDGTLDVVEEAFLDEEDDNVVVDESLFQDIDDLELGEDFVED